MNWSLRRFRGLTRITEDSTVLGIVVGVLLALLWSWLGDGAADLTREGSFIELLTWGSWKGEYTILGLLVGYWALAFGRSLLRRRWRGGWDSFRAIPAPPAQGLVLLLCPPRDSLILEQFEGLTGNLRRPETRAKLGTNPLRRPLEAIAHQVPELERVFIIDSKTADPPSALGNVDFRERFTAQLRKLDLPPTVQVDFVDRLGGTAGEGIDFSDVHKVFESTRKAVDFLGQQGYPPHKILIDVTSGTTLAACVGASVALEKNRGYQYVDDNYQVLVCDPVHEAEASA